MLDDLVLEDNPEPNARDFNIRLRELPRDNGR
jgi:hypothetical protein